MSQLQQTAARRARRLKRVTLRVRGLKERPRLCVKRSLLHVYAQVVDDTSGRTLAAARDSEIAEAERKGKKKAEVAFLVGGLIAERAKAQGVSAVVFDRRDKKYHGRVRALAEGARAGGLIF